MAKNQINFTKMTEETHTQLNSFKESALAIAKEDMRYKAETKPLRAELEKILTDRQKAIDDGMSVDEVTAKYSRTEVDVQLRKAELEHKAIVEPFNKAMNDSYAFVPDNMHSAYVKKIDEGKRGEFLDTIKVFLENLGIDGCTQGQISKFAESMSDKLGAKYASSKNIVENGTLVVAMKKNQFNKLFMAVFCDMYIK